MSYDAVVYRVMISCPGDAEQERDAARAVLYDWNSAHAEAERKILLPVDWRHDAVPDAGTPPQQSVNAQITDKADLLIAIFKHRLGTPTDKFPSGTVEEIQKFIEAGKPVWLYFSSEDIPQEKIDQFTELKEFQEQNKTSSFYREFSSIENFGQTLSQHIQMQAHNLPYAPIGDNRLVRNYKNIDEFTVRLLKTGATRGRIICAPSFDTSARDEAKLKNAIKTLEQLEFIQAEGEKREIFSLTQKGFDFVDSLPKEES
jgi:predicted transcriptional regulator